jgi:peptidoglycan/LPS O-acetylase OafA/YrhL
MILADQHPEQSVKAEIGHLDAIEGLRGVAVIWVVLFHYLLVRDPLSRDPCVAWIASFAPLNAVISNGYLGVDLFFLITGFLLVLPWARHAMEGAPAPSARAFYVRRIRRIVPAYYVQLILLFFVFVPLLWGLEFWGRNLWFGAYNAIAHALFLHYTTPISSASLSINGPLWSLALEFQYYLLLPLLAPFIVRAPLRWATGMILLALAWHWLAQNDLGPLVAFEMKLGAPWKLGEATIRHLLMTQLPGYLGHFAAGILVGLGWLKWRSRAPGRIEAAVWSLIAACSVGFVYWLYVAGGGGVVGEITWLATVAAFAFAMFSLVSRSGRLGQLLLGNRALTFVGRISYSTYLYHLPLLLIWNHYRVLSGSWLSLPAFLLAVGLAAWLSYRFVELPFMQKQGDRLAART